MQASAISRRKKRAAAFMHEVKLAVVSILAVNKGKKKTVTCHHREPWTGFTHTHIHTHTHTCVHTHSSAHSKPLKMFGHTFKSIPYVRT